MGYILDSSSFVSFPSGKNQGTNQKPVWPGGTFQDPEINKELIKPNHHDHICRIYPGSPLFKLCPYFPQDQRTTQTPGNTSFKGAGMGFGKIVC
jgi:hypothetical protein